MDLKTYIENALQQAKGHLAQTEQALAQHVATDFAVVEANLKALYSHCKTEVERLEAMLK